MADEPTNGDIVLKLDSFEKELRKMKEEMSAATSRWRDVDRAVVDLGRLRSEDMKEFRRLLKAATEKPENAQMAADVKRAIIILDGDKSLGVKGIRSTVEDLDKLKNRALWISIGLLAGGVGLGGGLKAIAEVIITLITGSP